VQSITKILSSKESIFYLIIDDSLIAGGNEYWNIIFYCVLKKDLLHRIASITHSSFKDVLGKRKLVNMNKKGQVICRLINNLRVNSPVFYHCRCIPFQNNWFVVVKWEPHCKEMTSDLCLGKQLFLMFEYVMRHFFGAVKWARIQCFQDIVLDYYWFFIFSLHLLRR